MNLPLSSDKPIDVTLFFDDATQAYLNFYKRVRSFSDNLTSYPIAKISDECAEIRTEQQQLAVLDQEMINILTLIGNDVSIEPLIDEYRKAFSLAASVCDELYANLYKIKETLLDLQSTSD